VSCGEGVRTRHVNCTENGTVVDDSICLDNIPNSKPMEEEACQGPHCNGYWVVGSWQKEVSSLVAVNMYLLHKFFSIYIVHFIWMSQSRCTVQKCILLK